MNGGYHHPEHGSSTSGGANMGVLNSSNHIGREVLLQKIGGKQVLHAAVESFYERLTTDPRIQPFFRDANLQILKWHQYNLMSIAFHNVPVDFDVEKLILEKHVYLFESGLDERTYDLVLDHFADTLRDLNVEEDVVLEALELVKPLRAIFEKGAKEAARRKALAKRRKQTFQIVAVGAGVVALSLLLNSRRKTSRKLLA